MADIELVIKISEEDYKLICAKREDAIVAHDTCRRIANGTPLPKRRGALITKGQAVALVEFYQQNPQHFTFDNLIEDIDKETPIVKAESEGN